MKFFGGRILANRGLVAPFTGAWIEISKVRWPSFTTALAPITGAWGEI